MTALPPTLRAVMADHFGVTPGGGRWVSDWVYRHSLTAEARAGLVLKEVTYTRNGKQFKRKQWVRAAAPAAKEKPAANVKAQPAPKPAPVDVERVYGLAGTAARNSEVNAAIRHAAGMPKVEATAVVKKLGREPVGDPRLQLAEMIHDRRSTQIRGLSSGAGRAADAKARAAFAPKNDEPLADPGAVFAAAPKPPRAKPAAKEKPAAKPPEPKAVRGALDSLGVPHAHLSDAEVVSKLQAAFAPPAKAAKPAAVKAKPPAKKKAPAEKPSPPQASPAGEGAGGFGSRGGDHHLQGATPAERWGGLARLAGEGDAATAARAKLADNPPKGLKLDSFAADVERAAAKLDGSTGRADVEPVYELVGGKYGLTKGEFVRAVLATNKDGERVRVDAGLGIENTSDPRRENGKTTNLAGQSVPRDPDLQIPDRDGAGHTLRVRGVDGDPAKLARLGAEADEAFKPAAPKSAPEPVTKKEPVGKKPIVPAKPSSPKVAATEKTLTAAVEKSKTIADVKEAEKHADGVLAKVKKEHTPAEIVEMARRVTGEKVRGEKDALQRLRANMTAVARLIESQDV